MTFSAFNFEVSGEVQGVNFRSGAVDKAYSLGLVGHVENTSSGTVTGEVQGDAQAVSQMREWLQHQGPPGSQIDSCKISGEKSNLDKLTYSSFEKH